MPQVPPSAWVCRFAPLIRRGGRVLDIAAGRGRHTRLLLDMGFTAVAVDRNTDGLRELASERCRVHQLDLEAGPPSIALQPLGSAYDGIVVTSYLHRPLFPWLAAALAPGGVLIYETFALGNERFGRPANPEHLLRPGELLDAFSGLTVVAFEQGDVTHPSPAAKQRIALVSGPVKALPLALDLDKAPPQD